MIFLTVGTIFPFDRLSRAMDTWAQDNPSVTLFGQLGDLGEDNYTPQHFKWTPRLSPVAFRDHITQADLVVTHAGIGTIVSALCQATPLLILPRKAAFQEVVNDHQMETVRRFADRPGITIALEPEDIPAQMQNALQKDAQVDALSDSADDSLITAIRDIIHR